jgi:secretion/DNA translocation related TadE-like protein
LRAIKVSLPIKSDRGSVTVLNLVLLVCLASLFVTVFSACDVVVQAHKLQSSADLSALAGAQLLLTQPSEVCNAAAALATKNGALLQSCAIDPSSVTVMLKVKTRSKLISRFAPSIWQEARAGF